MPWNDQQAQQKIGLPDRFVELLLNKSMPDLEDTGAFCCCISLKANTVIREKTTEHACFHPLSMASIEIYLKT